MIYLAYLDQDFHYDLLSYYSHLNSFLGNYFTQLPLNNYQ